MKLFAYCWENGLIAFGHTVPEGVALMAHSDNEELLWEKMNVWARHAYDGTSLLVPGIPEAKDPAEAVDALYKWLGFLNERQIAGITIVDDPFAPVQAEAGGGVE